MKEIQISPQSLQLESFKPAMARQIQLRHEAFEELEQSGVDMNNELRYELALQDAQEFVKKGYIPPLEIKRTTLGKKTFQHGISEISVSTGASIGTPALAFAVGLSPITEIGGGIIVLGAIINFIRGLNHIRKSEKAPQIPFSYLK